MNRKLEISLGLRFTVIVVKLWTTICNGWCFDRLKLKFYLTFEFSIEFQMKRTRMRMIDREVCDLVLNFSFLSRLREMWSQHLSSNYYIIYINEVLTSTHSMYQQSINVSLHLCFVYVALRTPLFCLHFTVHSITWWYQHSYRQFTGTAYWEHSKIIFINFLAFLPFIRFTKINPNGFNRMRTLRASIWEKT